MPINNMCERANLPLREELEGVSAVPIMRDPDRPGRNAVFSQFLREASECARRHRHVAPELYDHETDPTESGNLAANEAIVELVEGLDQRLGERFGP